MPKTSNPELIHFDVDAQAGSEYDPYGVKLGGQTIHFTDPRAIDWRVIEVDPSPSSILRAMMSPEDWDVFSKHPVPLNVLDRMFASMLDHFRITEGDPLFDALRQKSARGL